jgi:hypothetical protein
MGHMELDGALNGCANYIILFALTGGMDDRSYTSLAPFTEVLVE